MQIGCFRQEDGAFAGRLRTLTLDVPLRIVATGFTGHSRAPDWRVHLNDAQDDTSPGPEVGAGWTHSSDSVGDYIAVQLDCPGLPRAMRANLLPSKHDDDAWVLLWSPRLRRPKPE